MRGAWLALIACAWSAPAWAVQIASAPPELCALTYVTEVNKQRTIHRCSGTLISSNVVVTAAHCFDDQARGIQGVISIKCALRRQSMRGESFAFEHELTASTVRVNTLNAAEDESGDDFAFLRLDRPITTVVPMRVPSGFESFRSEFLTPSQTSAGNYELKPTVECRMSGFGVPDGTRQRLFVTSDHSPRKGLRAFFGDSGDSAKTMRVHAWGEEIEEMRHGDSGGAFYCRAQASDPWTLVAINVGNILRRQKKTGIREYAATASDSFQSFWRVLRAEWGKAF